VLSDASDVYDQPVAKTTGFSTTSSHALNAATAFVGHVDGDAPRNDRYGESRPSQTQSELVSSSMLWPRCLFVACLTALLLGPGQARSAGIQEWATQASREIARQIRRPSVYRRSTVPSTTIVQFVVDRIGSVSDIVVAKGSGSADLDDAVIRAVRSARPLPLPPMPPNTSTLKATLPITFQ
jgi:TonB family protein